MTDRRLLCPQPVSLVLVEVCDVESASSSTNLVTRIVGDCCLCPVSASCYEFHESFLCMIMLSALECLLLPSCAFRYVHMCANPCTHMQALTYASVCAHTRRHKYTCTHIHTHTHTHKAIHFLHGLRNFSSNTYSKHVIVS